MLWERLVHRRPRDPDPGEFHRVAPSFARPRAAADRLTVTWVGHSTLLIQIDGLNVLTDPMWGQRASPVSFAGPRRWVPPGIGFDELPPIDVVMLSHNHYDHLDEPTVRRLVARAPDAHWVTPLEVGAFVRARGAARVDELDWWEETTIGTLRFACAPAQHFSARGAGDRDATLWASWSIIGTNRRVHFGGDTGYHAGFAEIARRHGPFDIAALPVGAYEPRWFMAPVHMNPDDAVKAFSDLRAGTTAARRMVMVPIHWGTFKLTDEAMDEPPRATRRAWDAAGLRADDLWLLAHGETRAL
jgi:N-acyl-phosphatidylethanolamine-hydrolysing phospholipase D